jgi:hypothetical protein
MTDQFFDEEQFEAYRALGYHACRCTMLATYEDVLESKHLELFDKNRQPGPERRIRDMIDAVPPV